VYIAVQKAVCECVLEKIGTVVDAPEPGDGGGVGIAGFWV
jgi:hypothetical protein